MLCVYCISEDPPDKLTQAEVIYDGFSFCLEHVEVYTTEKMKADLRLRTKDTP